MIVGLDALAARFGGTAYAAIQISAALAKRRDIEQVLLIARPGSIPARGARGHADVRVLDVGREGRGELPRRVAWEAARLGPLLKRESVDGLFVLSGMLPRSLPVPVIGFQGNPNPYEERRRPGATLRRVALNRTARFARATYAPSAHVATLLGGRRGSSAHRAFACTRYRSATTAVRTRKARRSRGETE